MARYPRIDVVLDGYALSTDTGLAAFCSVVLVEALDASGALRRILVDPAHVGRRTFLAEALERRAEQTEGAQAKMAVLQKLGVSSQLEAVALLNEHRRAGRDA